MSDPSAPPDTASLADAVPCLVYVFDLERRETVYTNRQVVADLGYTPSEILELGPELLISLMHPDDLARMADLFARWAHVRDGESLASEYRLRDAAGRWRSFVGRDRVYERDADGHVRRVIGVALDVTSQRSEGPGREPRRMLDTLMSNLPGMAYRCANDPDWTMEFVSDGCLELTGFPATALLSNKERSYASLILPEDREGVWAEVQRAIEEQRPFVMAYRLRSATGDTRWVWEKGRAIYSEHGEVLALEGFVTDITERKRFEDQALQNQKLESLGVLAGGIAHDFNNLLTAILGNLTVALRAAPEDPELTHRLESAERACVQASSLTKRLLTFASGGAPVKQAHPIVQLVEDCSSLALAGSRARAHIEAPPDPCVAEIDAGQVSQVVNNLLMNAAQAMPDGGRIDIRIRHATVEPGQEPVAPGPYVAIEVQDHGSGVAEADLPRVFDPFFTTHPGASGLGLSTAYRIVQAHGGHIALESGGERGTIARVLLPASPRAPSATREVPAGGEEGGRERVLVMDDENLVLEVGAAMLRSLGYDVVTASDGSEAVQRYREAIEAGDRFDVVLLDLTVPGGMGGKETLAWLRDLDPRVRALVSSGYSNDPVMASPGTYGFLGVVPKPYRVPELASALRAALERRDP